MNNIDHGSNAPPPPPPPEFGGVGVGVGMVGTEVPTNETDSVDGVPSLAKISVPVCAPVTAEAKVMVTGRLAPRSTCMLVALCWNAAPSSVMSVTFTLLLPVLLSVSVSDLLAPRVVEPKSSTTVLAHPPEPTPRGPAPRSVLGKRFGYEVFWAP